MLRRPTRAELTFADRGGAAPVQVISMYKDPLHGAVSAVLHVAQ